MSGDPVVQSSLSRGYGPSELHSSHSSLGNVAFSSGPQRVFSKEASGAQKLHRTIAQWSQRIEDGRENPHSFLYLFFTSSRNHNYTYFIRLLGRLNGAVSTKTHSMCLGGRMVVCGFMTENCN